MWNQGITVGRTAHSFADANEVWIKGFTLRKYPDRRMMRQGSRDQWVDRHEDGSFSFRRHGIEIVRWHPDNSFTVTPSKYSNQDVFASFFMPSGFGAAFHRYGGPWVSSNHDKYYRVTEPSMRFTNTPSGWVPDRIQEPWTIYDLSNRAIKAYNARGVPAFARWARTVVALGGWARGEEVFGKYVGWGSALNGDKEVRSHAMELLADQSRWMDMLRSPALTGYAADGETAARNVVKKLQRMIRIEDKCVDKHDVDVLDGFPAFRSWLKNMREYRYVET